MCESWLISASSAYEMAAMVGECMGGAFGGWSNHSMFWVVPPGISF